MQEALVSWSQMLFGFSGRCGRARFWLGVAIQVGAFGVTILLIYFGIDTFDLTVGNGGSVFIIILLGAFFLVLLYSMAAVGVKRLHDRGRSSWWPIVFYMVPTALVGGAQAAGGGSGLAELAFAGLLISIWGIVELGFLRGTDGANAYGPDPLSARPQPPRSAKDGDAG